MQAWIPIVSSSLYFRKSVFSFWVDSILKWRVYIKIKVSWMCAFLWCMSQTSHDRVNSRHVRTHKKKSRDAVRGLGTLVQSRFVPNQEPVFAWPFGNGPVRVGTQGLFRQCLKTFIAPFLPARLTAPGSPRMRKSKWSAWPFVNNTKKCTFKEIETEKKKRRNRNIEKAAWNWRTILNWIKEISQVQHCDYPCIRSPAIKNPASLEKADQARLSGFLARLTG